ncbi:hypothetical protein BX616_003815, partial [Lobosporangium transversale]
MSSTELQMAATLKSAATPSPQHISLNTLDYDTDNEHVVKSNKGAAIPIDSESPTLRHPSIQQQQDASSLPTGISSEQYIAILADPPTKDQRSNMYHTNKAISISSFVDVKDSSLSIKTSQPSTLLQVKNNTSPISPNQLQGVVVESLKTPTEESGDDSSNEHGHTGNTEHIDSATPVDSDICKVFTSKNMHSNPTEDQRGVPWMLYRHRSHSTGAEAKQHSSSSIFSHTTMLGFESRTGLNHIRSISVNQPSDCTYTVENKKDITGESLTTPIARVGSCQGRLGLGSEVNPNCSSRYEQSLPRTIDTEGSMRVLHYRHHHTLHRSGSNRTSGKSLYSAYRKHFNTLQAGTHVVSSQITDTSSTTNIAAETFGPPSSTIPAALSANTDSLNIAINSPKPMGSTEFQPSFTRSTLLQHQLQYRYQQRLRNMQPMEASNPVSFTSLDASAVSSPALSCHSDSTMVSSSSRSSCISGSLHSSNDTTLSLVYMNSADDMHCSSAIGSPSGLTLLNSRPENGQHHGGYQSSRFLNKDNDARKLKDFVRKAFAWMSCWSTPHTNNDLKPSSSVLEYDTTPTSRTTLQELSGKESGLYNRASQSSPPSPPTPSPIQLSSSLYYISGLTDLRQARKRGGRSGAQSRDMLPDEKAFFSNERTYLHWIKFGLLIGSTALTLLSFAEAAGYRVGLCLVTVAMSTLAYSTAMFHLRHRWMIQLRRDVKYYDRFGPTVLFMALFLA